MAYEPGDLAIKIDSYKLNIRAAGVIIHNGKIRRNSKPLCPAGRTCENRRKLTRHSKT